MTFSSHFPSSKSVEFAHHKTPHAGIIRRFSPAFVILTALWLGLTFVILQTQSGKAAGTGPSHGFALNHDLKYPVDFPHLDYVNPNAPKGGTITLEGSGSFDTLNPFTVKGNPAAGLGRIYESLMSQVQDETSAMYGLVAKSVEIAEDESWIEFKLRKQARFHDGHPITSEDVDWTFETLRSQGRPFYRYYYAAVSSIDTPDDHTIRFNMTPGENKEMPLILGQLVILPKHYWESRDFEKTTLDPPLGSGAYKITNVDAGKSITYERVTDYWADSLPVNIGFNNFDTVRYEFYRDRTISREAFKAGAIDLWAENSAKEWATAFNIEAVTTGSIQKQEFPHNRVAPMQGFIFNLRKEQFTDPVLREALSYAWDFEWVNKTIMYSAYQRTDSFFDNHELSATGLPSKAELAILEPLRGQIPERVFTETYTPPHSDGNGRNRSNLRKATKLLKESGWTIQDGALINPQTGAPLTFEILLRSETLEPHTQAWVRGLERLGVKTTIRIVDDAQYRKRLDSFDFDVTITVFAQSDSPGNEQRDFWGSESAKREAGRNLIGIQDPAIDSLIETLIAAPDRETLITRTHALDRVLLWNHFLVPMYHSQGDRLAYWNRFGQPDIIPESGVVTGSWWIDPALDKTLSEAHR